MSGFLVFASPTRNFSHSSGKVVNTKWLNTHFGIASLLRMAEFLFAGRQKLGGLVVC
jgi:hypothetical protein